MKRRPNIKPTPEDIHFILTSDLSQSEIRRIIGCGRQFVADVLKGKIYADLHPELPRNRPRTVKPKTCLDCNHYTTHCTMRFPEYELIGLRAATSCEAFASERYVEPRKTNAPESTYHSNPLRCKGSSPVVHPLTADCD